MDYHYKHTGSFYVLHDGDEPIGKPTEEIAIAFDRETGTLQKHGEPAYVTYWVADAQKRLRFLDPQMADDLIAVSGRFPVDEINRCISTSGYAKRFHEKLLAGQIQPIEDIDCEHLQKGIEP
jgi:hypothetical protein